MLSLTVNDHDDALTFEWNRESEEHHPVRYFVRRPSLPFPRSRRSASVAPTKASLSVTEIETVEGTLTGVSSCT